MLAETYKPLESALSMLSQDYLTPEISPSFVKSVFSAEIEMDTFLVKSVHAILIAQDATITEAWVDDSAQSREQLKDIISKQCEIHKIMDRLGESLAERFVKLAQMLGITVDLPTLKRLWKQVSEKLSARIMKVSSTVDNAFGPFMESSSETMSRTISQAQDEGSK